MHQQPRQEACPSSPNKSTRKHPPETINTDLDSTISPTSSPPHSTATDTSISSSPPQQTRNHNTNTTTNQLTSNFASSNNTSWSQQGQYSSMGNTIHLNLTLVKPPAEFGRYFGGENGIGLFSGIKLPQLPTPIINTVPQWTQATAQQQLQHPNQPSPPAIAAANDPTEMDEVPATTNYDGML